MKLLDFLFPYYLTTVINKIPLAFMSLVCILSLIVYFIGEKITIVFSV